MAEDENELPQVEHAKFIDANGNETDQDPDAEDEEAEEEAQVQQIVSEASNRALRNKLNKILHTPRILPVLTPSEIKTVNQGKTKYPQIVAKIHAKLAAQKAQSASAAGGTLATLGHVLLVVGIVFLVALLLAALIDSFLSIFGGGSGDGSGGNNGANGSEFGTSSKYLYGMRAIYEDDDEARKYLVTDYALAVNYTITEVNNAQNSYIINVKLPESEFDYSNLIENYLNTSYDYYNFANTTFDYTQTIYNNDVSLGLTEAGATTFVDILNKIPYFGLVKDETLINNLTSTLATKLQNFVKSTDEENNPTPDVSNLNNLINTALNTYFEKYTARTQKYFVVDYFAKNDAYAPSLTTKHNYKAYIYLNKQNLNVSYLSYVTTSHINFEIYNNQNKIAVNDMGEFATGSGTWMYETNNNLNLNITSTEIHFADEQILLDGKNVALLDLLSSAHANSYLVKEENDIYTYNVNGLYLKFNENQNFAISEFTTTVS